MCGESHSLRIAISPIIESMSLSVGRIFTATVCPVLREGRGEGW